MTQLSELNGISIAEIVVYTPALCIGILLAIRHGFRRSSGWLYIILFSLIRILGAALQLATISDPNNASLQQGAATLQNVGLSALILTMLGLLSRALDSIRKTTSTIIQPQYLRLVQMVVLAGLILGIVGGSKTASVIEAAARQGNAAAYTAPIESRVGLGLLIAGFAIVTVATAVAGAQVRAAEPGEKRLVLANALALPFVLVRLVFSAIGTYTTNSDFRAFGSSANYANYLLGMAIIMEMIAIVIFEAVGLTLQKLAVGRKAENIPLGSRSGARDGTGAYAGQVSGVERV